MTSKQFSDSHERANSWSHGLTLVLMIIFYRTFVEKTKVHFDSFAVLLFYASSSFMLLSSTMYHYSAETSTKNKWRVCDHISIFWVIGATALPFVLKYANNPIKSWFIVIQWSTIILGSVLKVFFTGRFRKLSTLLYILIGCSVLILGKDFWTEIPNKSLRFLISGGSLYIVGTVFYLYRNIPYNHFIWHLFVSAALISQAYAMFVVSG
jgi:hemolysin III